MNLSVFQMFCLMGLLTFLQFSPKAECADQPTNETGNEQTVGNSELFLNDDGLPSCIIKKGDTIYDLRKLSQRKYWFYSELAHNSSTLMFLLSVCHPVSNSVCQENDGICFSFLPPGFTHNSQAFKLDVLKQGSFISGGKMVNTLPEVEEEGRLKYVFTNGSICMKGKNLRYKTELYMRCPSISDTESSGPILMSSPNCLFIFVWMTFAACPKKVDTTPDPCVIKFSNSEYPLNLHSLHNSTFYKVDGGNSSFELNICGPIQNGSCPDNTAVCDISNKENPKVLATSEDISFNWQGDALTAYFNSSVKPYSTSIYLHCDRFALSPKILFSFSLNFYKFSIYTVTVCNPQSSDCVFDDDNLNVYDLRPLYKKEGNWEVVGEQGNKSVLFNLNVCGPLNPNKNSKCPPGPIGACQPSVSVSGSRNMGYISSNPVVHKDGSITILYPGGDPCRKGAFSSSTRISFICSNITYLPVFLRTTDSCEHLFEWHTTAACPVNVVSSSNCFVTDPLFGHNFDLTSLRNDTADYVINNGEDSFRINVCGPLVTPCGDSKDGTSVCLTGEEEKSGGTYPTNQLVFNDGTLTMKFSNGASDPLCNGGEGGKWSSKILFLCSHAGKGLDGLQYIDADKKSCVHQFIWHTTAACPPHREVDCFVREGDLLYDLTPLSNPNLNEIFITYQRLKKYVVNVCRSVIHSKEGRCAYDAGACVIDLSHENRTLNLGKVTGGPYVEHDQLKIKYEGGDLCNGSKSHSTIIEFECTEEQYLSYPILYATEECLTLFKWSSVHACSRNVSVPSEEAPKSDCTAVNPLTNYVFDMNSLRKEKPYELSMGDGSTLLVTACGIVKDPRCKGIDTESGACVVPRDSSLTPWSGGKWNKALQFRMWSTYLEYEGGLACDNGLSRSTRISFICKEKDSSVTGPILISEDNSSCTFFINWYTEEACERHIRCFAYNWEITYDLSPLIRTWGNYEVQDQTNSSYIYLINVCRPLNPVIGVNCHPGSSICLVRKNQEPLSLGHPILNPSVVEDNKVELMYAHGSACPTEPGSSLSSRIIFECNHTAGAGTPRFYRNVEDCQTQFKWETSLVCPAKHEGEVGCQIAYEAAKTNVNLSPLKRSKPYVIFHRNLTIRLNICGATVCGEDIAVCGNNDVNYGRSGQTELRWDHGTLLLNFFGGSPCEGSVSGARSTRIYFECDPKVRLGYPMVDPIMDDIRCMVVIIWRTNLTCLESLYYTPKPSLQTTPPPKENPFTPKSSSLPYFNSSTPHPPTSDPYGEDLSSQHTWVSVTIATVVLLGVIGASVYVVGRSAYGRRLYTRAKRTLARKGYASPAENDTLLQGETAYVYRVDEDEQILRV